MTLSPKAAALKEALAGIGAQPAKRARVLLAAARLGCPAAFRAAAGPAAEADWEGLEQALRRMHVPPALRGLDHAALHRALLEGWWSVAGGALAALVAMPPRGAEQLGDLARALPGARGYTAKDAQSLAAAAGLGPLGGRVAVGPGAEAAAGALAGTPRRLAACRGCGPLDTTPRVLLLQAAVAEAAGEVDKALAGLPGVPRRARPMNGQASLCYGYKHETGRVAVPG